MTSLNGQTIGFIGLGLMGKPMARNLKAAGAEMIVHNRSQGVIEELSGAGMTPAKTPADAAGAAETVILMLPDTAAVEKVLRSADGVVGGLKPGGLVIDMGTTKVIATRTFARDVEAAGGDYIDAPVSGGTIGAEGGTLTIMAGGSDAAMEKAKPVFDVLGQSTTHADTLGGDAGPCAGRGGRRFAYIRGPRQTHDRRYVHPWRQMHNPAQGPVSGAGTG